MEDSTSIAQLNGRDNKVSLDNVSYSDILGQMQQQKSQPISMDQQPIPTSSQTPINQLPSINMGNTMGGPNNYSDPSRPDLSRPDLTRQDQGMYSMQNMQHVQQHPNFIPSAYNARARESDESSENVTAKENSTGDFQNEMFVLLVIYVLIHTEQFQTLIRTKLPSMFNSQTNNINIFGTLMNGIFLIVAWNIAKKIVIKYMKEFN